MVFMRGDGAGARVALAAAVLVGMMAVTFAATRRSAATPEPAVVAHRLDMAAQAGSPQAMFLLANAYRAGAGVPQSNAQALAWYERAAERGHPSAMQTLAMAHLYGELGLVPDELESRRYAMEAEHALHDSPPPR